MVHLRVCKIGHNKFSTDLKEYDYDVHIHPHYGRLSAALYGQELFAFELVYFFGASVAGLLLCRAAMAVVYAFRTSRVILRS